MCVWDLFHCFSHAWFLFIWSIQQLFSDKGQLDCRIFMDIWRKIDVLSIFGNLLLRTIYISSAKVYTLKHDAVTQKAFLTHECNVRGDLYGMVGTFPVSFFLLGIVFQYTTIAFSTINTQ